MATGNASVPATFNVKVFVLLVLLIAPATVSALPLLTASVAESFKETAGVIWFAVPSVTFTAAPAPALSKVKISPLTFVITIELALFSVALPMLSLAFKVTVRKALSAPKVAESPAAPGKLGLLLQFAPTAQLPSTPVAQVAATPDAATVKITLLPLTEITPALPSATPFPPV